ncbi:hypothetical protein F4778DRAFT_783115 [Xylariomycetidae sp. FL2044]|nr:hypothetical protein F4778DRAFT_783115 [Xylariomycetidae sp. FL2044]
MNQHGPPIIIIVGAGVVGLSLAQALRQEAIDFQIFDSGQVRDLYTPGWGINLHWALPALQTCLPADMFREIDAIQLSPQDGKQSIGEFLLVDSSTGDVKGGVPQKSHKRVDRAKYRKLLSANINIHWNKMMSEYTIKDNGVLVSFSDGTQAFGPVLVAADGASGRGRAMLPRAQSHTTSINTGSNMKLTRKNAKSLDVSSAGHTGASDVGPKSKCEAILIDNWLVQNPSGDMLDQVSNEFGRITLLTSSSEQEDRRPCTGRVAVIGHAAHQRTNYRGEAVNHGITDAAKLRDELRLWKLGQKSLEDAVDDSQAEVQTRAHEADLLTPERKRS